MRTDATLRRVLPALLLSADLAFAGTCRAPGRPQHDSPADVDVAIIGGGFSGMASAYQLHQAGLNVVVLEATERLGGRSRSHPLESGPGLVELGATWINNQTQGNVTALAYEFGLELLEQVFRRVRTASADWWLGDKGARRQSARRRGTSTIPSTVAERSRTDHTKDEETAAILLAAEDFADALTDAENDIDITIFDEFPIDEDVSFDAWVRRNETWANNPLVMALASQLTTAIVGREPKDVGAHYWFDYTKSGGGWEALLDDGEFGAQRHMIKTGTTSIVTNIKDAMPKDSVLTKQPVTKIKQEKDNVILTTSTGQQWRAKKAILAIMPSTYNKIDFSPALPEDKQGLITASQEGHYAKVLVTYADAWWRAANLTGQFFSFTGPITYCLETAVPDLEQYSLACFVAGDFALEWFDLSDAEKKEAITEHLATMVEEEDVELAELARDAIEINYVAWTKEEYVDGGPTNAMGPGMLRKYGETLRASVDKLHFAGTETAYEWKGYLEGAVAAGYRAADEVLEALSGDKK